MKKTLLLFTFLLIHFHVSCSQIIYKSLEKRTRSINMGSNHPKNSSGLVILNNESIHSFLLSASKDSLLSQELQATAYNLSSLNNVPYKSVRQIWVESHPLARPKLSRLFSGSEFVFTSPKPREKVIILLECQYNIFGC